MTKKIKNFSDAISFKKLLIEIENLVGKDNLNLIEKEDDDSYQRRNVSLFKCRDIKAIVTPRFIKDIQEIIRIFNQNSTNISLHAISTGRNWGLGSAEPATDNVVTLDLRKLSSIRNINCEEGWAIIEPGVTQLKLSQSLDGSKRIFNITASSGHTSVLGNILERGVGLRRQRIEDLVGLEVITPEGELIRVGWWPHPSKNTAINFLGHGPSLLHLFTQSNLGIVTAAVVKLLPRPEEQKVLRLRFRRDVLNQSIDLLRRWYAQELISGVLKIYDSVSTESYGGSSDEHLVLLCISGTSAKVNALTNVIRSEAEESGFFSSISQSGQSSEDSSDFVLQVVEHAYAGDPSWNEHMLRAATGKDADQVDTEGGGWIFFLAFIPFNGKAVEDALSIIEKIYHKTKIRVGITVNALSSDVIDLVISIKFSPQPEETSRAHKTLDLLYELFSEIGFYPYRLDVDHSHYSNKFFSNSEYEMNKKIKAFLDPKSIISPGRYA
ncbi:FAD-binding oxidoreductase [Xenorhabdus bovienii]|uniref:FAD-binding oxidoreductase n=1 Tax=Xenorhabdus bovienii TaxID=40576 RepID=UPI0023B25654|nr:FAD-binding oxidoreductase [Xenorhabdus bovienii]MDE9544601.1 FAD-binding oxidoreductase [Xenorhabdus bovienii]